MKLCCEVEADIVLVWLHDPVAHPVLCAVWLSTAWAHDVLTVWGGVASAGAGGVTHSVSQDKRWALALLPQLCSVQLVFWRFLFFSYCCSIPGWPECRLLMRHRGPENLRTQYQDTIKECTMCAIFNELLMLQQLNTSLKVFQRIQSQLSKCCPP